MQRYRDIVTAFSRNGFGYIAVEMGLHDLLSIPKRIFMKDKQKIRKKTTGERIRLFMEALGPTFIKLGQFASTRSDILPKDIIIELERLQDHVSPFSTQEAITIIERELGSNIDTLFSEFKETPLAAASIGQVHYAVLHSGKQVAVKIQRPNVFNTVRTDLEILNDLAALAESRLEIAAKYHVRDIIKEFSISLREELDYMNEGRNAEKIAKQFVDNPKIAIPNIYWEYTSQKVLTMEFVQGTKLNDPEKLVENNLNQSVLAENVVDSMFHQIFIEGFFHGDPHPGNILAQKEEQIVFMDFGLVGRVTAEMRGNLSSFVIALMRQNTDGMVKAISKMGMVEDDVDMTRLRKDIDLLKDKYYDVPLSQVSLGDAVNDLFSVAYKHHIKIPADLTLLGKTLLTIEGLVEELDPNLSIIKMAEPFGRQLLKERYHPKKVSEQVIRDLTEYGEIISDMPQTIKELKQVIKKGKIRLEVSAPEVDKSLRKLDKISNRLSFSIVLLSFSIIMVGLIVGSAVVRQSTLLWNIPVIEVGFIIAIIMFLWILYAIFRSGRF
ncbi:2-octaprenylphenol hydroxylase [Ornithinibacillus halophilus]|uniref:2-octaprenylphenol hydroxylase n=1 Tax=Ornithinibacillus halophilus TaxID=930117 RepID=A0A1M5E0R4_9BACI|nr:2-octaprenylphenol hydroxylase [Ornithinibacillus halophilus]